ncbi:Transcription factor Sox-2 [Entophlyctis sp. JEL0112]|nr:Transcription factor Sox-2 [Entophlyctis sp. JEL0112]
MNNIEQASDSLISLSRKFIEIDHQSSHWLSSVSEQCREALILMKSRDSAKDDTDSKFEEDFEMRIYRSLLVSAESGFPTYFFVPERQLTVVATMTPALKNNFSIKVGARLQFSVDGNIVNRKASSQRGLDKQIKSHRILLTVESALQKSKIFRRHFESRVYGETGRFSTVCSVSVTGEEFSKMSGEAARKGEFRMTMTHKIVDDAGDVWDIGLHSSQMQTVVPASQENLSVAGIDAFWSPPPASTSNRIPSANTHKNNSRTARIPRPPNAFILYRSHKQPELVACAKGQGKSSRDFSRILGDMWAAEDPTVRLYYQALAADCMKRHREMYPAFQYRSSLPRSTISLGTDAGTQAVKTLRIRKASKANASACYAMSQTFILTSQKQGEKVIPSRGDVLVSSNSCNDGIELDKTSSSHVPVPDSYCARAKNIPTMVEFPTKFEALIQCKCESFPMGSSFVGAQPMTLPKRAEENAKRQIASPRVRELQAKELPTHLRSPLVAHTGGENGVSPSQTADQHSKSIADAKNTIQTLEKAYRDIQQMRRHQNNPVSVFNECISERDTSTMTSGIHNASLVHLVASEALSLSTGAGQMSLINLMSGIAGAVNDDILAKVSALSLRRFFKIDEDDQGIERRKSGKGKK